MQARRAPAGFGDPISAAGGSREQRMNPALRIPRRRCGGEADAHERAHCAPAREREDGADSVEELRRILQGGTGSSATTPRSSLGFSPPARGSGACNPQAGDGRWRNSNAAVCHSNMQALRELDARGVSFLRPGAWGDARLLAESPAAAGDGGAAPALRPASHSSGRSSSSCAPSRHSTPRVCQVGFVIA